MDWNILLFASRWAMIGLFYAVLLVLLVGVYRESSQRLKKEKPASAVLYGRLKLVRPGSDPRLKPGEMFDLKKETSLGTDADNDIVLGDPYVSRHHARIWWDGASWWIVDLNSRNGTLVHQKPCIPEIPQALKKKGAITIGEMEFELVD